MLLFSLYNCPIWYLNWPVYIYECACLSVSACLTLCLPKSDKSCSVNAASSRQPLDWTLPVSLFKPLLSLLICLSHVQRQTLTLCSPSSLPFDSLILCSLICFPSSSSQLTWQCVCGWTDCCRILQHCSTCRGQSGGRIAHENAAEKALYFIVLEENAKI